ncbi:MAG: hypothetical protein QW303_07050, partial [Nitrososphaerota archaeon]
MIVIVDDKFVRGEYLQEGVPEIYCLGEDLYGICHEGKKYVAVRKMSCGIGKVDVELDFSQSPKIQYIGSVNRGSTINHYYQNNQNCWFIIVSQEDLFMEPVKPYIKGRLRVYTLDYIDKHDNYIVVSNQRMLINTETCQIYEFIKLPAKHLISEAVINSKIDQLVQLVKLYSERKISHIGKYNLERALFENNTRLRVSLVDLLNEFDKPSIKESIFAGMTAPQLNLKNAVNMIDKVQIDNQLTNLGIDICVIENGVLVRHVVGGKTKHIVYGFDKRGYKGRICFDNRVSETYIVDFCNKYSLCREL